MTFKFIAAKYTSPEDKYSYLEDSERGRRFIRQPQAYDTPDTFVLVVEEKVLRFEVEDDTRAKGDKKIDMHWVIKQAGGDQDLLAKKVRL